MAGKKTSDKTTLDIVTATIVNYLGQVNLYHYNKLTYLFEYFYIKHFGERFTKELFIKLPHGPVIQDYKAQISDLCERDVIDVDLHLLNKHRAVDSDYSNKINIYRNENTSHFSLKSGIEYTLLTKIIEKYAHYSINDLETIVYKTEPVVNYLLNFQSGFIRKEFGGYVLKSCNMKITEAKSNMTPGVKEALKHLKKYPNPDYEQMRKDIKEFSFMEKLRPAYD